MYSVQCTLPCPSIEKSFKPNLIHCKFIFNIVYDVRIQCIQSVQKASLTSFEGGKYLKRSETTRTRR